MLIGHYLRLLHRSQGNLAAAFRSVAGAHEDDADVGTMCRRFAKQCDGHEQLLTPFVARYADEAHEAEALHTELFNGVRKGKLGLLRDLHDLYLMATECDIVWTLMGQAAQGARDRELLDVVSSCEGETSAQVAWLKSRMKQAAPQILVVIR